MSIGTTSAGAAEAPDAPAGADPAATCGAPSRWPPSPTARITAAASTATPAIAIGQRDRPITAAGGAMPMPWLPVGNTPTAPDGPGV